MVQTQLLKLASITCINIIYTQKYPLNAYFTPKFRVIHLRLLHVFLNLNPTSKSFFLLKLLYCIVYNHNKRAIDRQRQNRIGSKYNTIQSIMNHFIQDLLRDKLLSIDEEETETEIENYSDNNDSSNNDSDEFEDSIHIINDISNDDKLITVITTTAPISNTDAGICGGGGAHRRCRHRHRRRHRRLFVDLVSDNAKILAAARPEVFRQMDERWDDTTNNSFNNNNNNNNNSPKKIKNNNDYDDDENKDFVRQMSMSDSMLVIPKRRSSDIHDRDDDDVDYDEDEDESEGSSNNGNDNSHVNKYKQEKQQRDDLKWELRRRWSDNTIDFDEDENKQQQRVHFESSSSSDSMLVMPRRRSSRELTMADMISQKDSSSPTSSEEDNDINKRYNNGNGNGNTKTTIIRKFKRVYMMMVIPFSEGRKKQHH